MGFGKAQKRARNLKKKADERKEFLSKVSKLEDGRMYSLAKENGELYFNGMVAHGIFWKRMHGLVK